MMDWTSLLQTSIRGGLCRSLEITAMPVPYNLLSRAGLPSLERQDQLVVCRQRALLSSHDEYRVSSPSGRHILTATDRPWRWACGPRASQDLRMAVFDTRKLNVMDVFAPLSCGGDRMMVFIHGQLEATVSKKRTFVKPVFKVRNLDDELLLKIKGYNNNFNILDESQNQIGMISRDADWLSSIKDVLLDREYFYLRFPTELDVRCKAVLVACCFFMDFLSYK